MWLLALAPAGCGKGGELPARGGPIRNVLLISLDTLRADRVGARRGEVPLTPRLDAFSARAVRFTNCRSASGHTLASHKSILSGRLPTAWLETFSRDQDPSAGALDPNRYYRSAMRAWPTPSVASRLRERGLLAAAFTDGVYLDPRYGLGAGFGPYESRRLGLRRQVKLARAWLEENAASRFFLFVHTYDVHCPYNPPPRYLELLGHQCTGRLQFAGHCGKGYFDSLDLTDDEKEHIAVHYDAGVRRVDDELGEFLDWLDSTGRLADTVVIVTSDHGESLGEREFVGHGELYDNQLHVPLVIYGPGFSPAVTEAPVSGVDVGATILDLLLGEVPPGLDGRSLVPLLEGKRSEAFRERVRLAAIAINEGREQRTRLGKVAVMAPDGMKAIVDDDDGTPDEVYDIVADPGETENLVPSGSAEAEKMRELGAAARPGPLTGLGGGVEDLGAEGLSQEDIDSLRVLGYVED